MNRRMFLSGAVALGMSAGNVARQSDATSAGPLTQRHERILANRDDRAALGRPDSWALADEGLHPIVPERVVVIEPSGLGRYAHSAFRPTMRRIKTELESTQRRRLAYGTDKLAVIARMAQTMTSYYGVPRAFELWAMRGAKREQLGSSGLTGGLALFHQFQANRYFTATTRNAPVDWWLFLLPQGIEYDTLDGRPVQAIFAHVFTRPWELVGRQLLAWELTCRVAWHASNSPVPGEQWDATGIASLTPADAARYVNARILKVLEGEYA